MPLAHREGDARSCGAVTVVQGQNTVRINGRLWAVLGDPNTHGGGELINSIGSVRINGKPIIVKFDSALPDTLGHPNPSATGSSDSVRVT